MPYPVQARRKAPIDRGPLHLRTGDKRRMSSHIPAGPWLDGPPGGNIGARIAASRRSTRSPLKCFLPGRNLSRIGAGLQLKRKDIWAIRVRLQLEGRGRDLAMFNLAIDSKLRCRSA